MVDPLMSFFFCPNRTSTPKNLPKVHSLVGGGVGEYTIVISSSVHKFNGPQAVRWNSPRVFGSKTRGKISGTQTAFFLFWRASSLLTSQPYTNHVHHPKYHRGQKKAKITLFFFELILVNSWLSYYFKTIN